MTEEIDMAFCSNCGQQVEDDAKFCIFCGAEVDMGNRGGASKQTSSAQSIFEEKFGTLLAYEDTTASFNPEDIKMNKAVSVLSYLHILVLVPLIGMKESSFAQYHAKKGLNYFVWHLIIGVVSRIVDAVFGGLWLIGGLLSLACSLAGLLLWALAIYGVVSVVQGRARSLVLFSRLEFIK